MPKNTKKPVEPEPEEPESEEQEEPEIDGEEDQENDDFEGQFESEGPSEEEEKLLVEIKKAEDEGAEETLVDLLTQLASILSLEQEVPRAIDTLRREIELRIKLNHEDITKLKNARANLSVLLQVVGDYAGSLESIEQAIESARKRKNVFDEAEALSDKATMYLAKYEMEKQDQEDEEEEEESEEIPEDILRSIQAGEEALKLCYDKNTDSKLLESDVARRANHAMGEAYMHIPDIEKAIPHWDQVVELSSNINENGEAVAALNSAGKAYFASAEALELAEQEEGVDNNEAKTKMVEKALGVFQKAKSRVQEEDHEDLMETLSGFVSCYDMLKQSDKAVQAQKEILAVVVKAEDDEAIIEAHMTLSDMYRESGKFVDAVKELNNAKKVAQTLELDDITETIDDAIAQLQNESKDSLKGKKQKK